MEQNFGNLPPPNAHPLSRPFGEPREEGSAFNLGHDEASLRSLFEEHRAHSRTPSRYPQKLQAAACSFMTETGQSAYAVAKVCGVRSVTVQAWEAKQGEPIISELRIISQDEPKKINTNLYAPPAQQNDNTALPVDRLPSSVAGDDSVTIELKNGTKMTVSGERAQDLFEMIKAGVFQNA